MFLKTDFIHRHLKAKQEERRKQFFIKFLMHLLLFLHLFLHLQQMKFGWQCRMIRAETVNPRSLMKYHSQTLLKLTANLSQSGIEFILSDMMFKKHLSLQEMKRLSASRLKQRLAFMPTVSFMIS